MQNATIKKEIINTLKDFSTSPKELNYCFGVDFEQSEHITINKGVGKFTINQLVKNYALKGDNLNIIVLKRQNDDFRGGNKLIILDKYFNIELYKNNFMRSFDNYYCKKDFENDRKKDNIKYIVISVKRENLKRVKENYYQVELNMAKDYKNDSQNLMRIESYKKVNEWYNGDNNYQKGGISNFDDCKIGNKTFDLKVDNCYNYNIIKSPYDYIDKSGYNINLKRMNLKSDARALKARREKDNLNKSEVNYKQIAENITVDFQNKIVEISEAIKNIDINKKEDLQKLDFLTKILKDLQFNANFYQEKVKNDIINKNFASVEKCQSVINEYKTRANINLNDELKKKAEWLAEFNKKYQH